MRMSARTVVALAILVAACSFGRAYAEVPIQQLLLRDTVGIVDSEGAVSLKLDLDQGTPAHTYRVVGAEAATVPVAGRWDPDTTESVGLFRGSDATFLLRPAQSSGPPIEEFSFFESSAPRGPLYPLMGDWNGSGLATAGVFDQSTGTVYLKNENNTQSEISLQFANPGVAGPAWLPIAGDWNGDGTDQIGLLDRVNMVLRLIDDPPLTTYTSRNLPPVGEGELRPVAGDWTANGRDGLGVYDVESGTFWFIHSLDDVADWDLSLPFAGGDDPWPVAGSWDGEALRQEVPRTPGGSRSSAFPQLVEATDGGHHLYFTSDSEALPGVQSIFYNRRSGPHVYSNTGWQLSQSLEVLGTPGAAALGVVLSTGGQAFRHPDGSLYEFLMVLVVEQNDTPEIQPYAGWVCISYGISPTEWTPPFFATTSPAADPRPCVDPDPPDSDFFPEEILAELVSGFRAGDGLFFGVMNGDNPALLQDAKAGSLRTQTYLYTATLEEPWVWTREGELEQRLVTPNTGGNWVHNFGINLDLTFDGESGRVLWSRSYPFPFDLAGDIPCDSDGSCPDGVSLNPNRFQIYALEPPCFDPDVDWLTPSFWCPAGASAAATLPDFTELHTFNYTLLFDGGAPAGYPSEGQHGCRPTLLASPSQAGFLGLDVNSVRFVKNLDGWVARDLDGKRSLVLGEAAVKHKANGECDSADESFYLWQMP